MTATRGLLGSLVLLAGGSGARPAAYGPLLVEAFAATGKRVPRIAYLGAANGDDLRFFSYMETLLRAAGPCTVESIPLAGKGPGPKARAALEASDLVCLGGGDVETGMEVLRRAGAIDWLRRKHVAGAPFVGFSAGAIMLCRQWVRWRDPEDDASAEPFDCLSLAPIICDTHGEEDGWTELRTLLRRLGDPVVGYGIRAGAALGVGPLGEVAVKAGVVDTGTWRSFGGDAA